MNAPRKSVRLGTIIASRTLREADGARVTVQFGRPRRSDKDWLCPFRIVGLSNDVVHRAYGVDSLQALQLAIDAARAMVRSCGRPLDWLGQSDLGFGRTVPGFIGQRRVDRLNRAVDREVKLWGRAIRRRAQAKANQR